MRSRWQASRPALGLILIGLLVCGGRSRPSSPELALELEPFASGLTSPLAITHAGDGSGRLFITQQDGRVMIHDGVQLRSSPFLDISTLVSCCGERGLLSLAFHPDFASNGLFFVYYTDLAGNAVVARYAVSGEPNLADPASGQVVFTLPQPFPNHNGGQLQFGPDGFLYAATGDGGGSGDPLNTAQDLGTTLGKLLRVDVNGPTPFAPAPNNPFLGVPGAQPEIWASGLRNPWRFSFDRLTGDLFVADVGQARREEVSFQPAASLGGENYGWSRMEGTLCFDPAVGCDDGSLVLPILEYDHALGCSITGGYRYRGDDHFALSGVYLYGDFCSGRIWGATLQGSSWTTQELLDTSLLISAFGEDESGELYVADLASGSVQRIGLRSACEDGFDNDDDGLTDHPDDPGCRDAEDATESAACQDGINNDPQEDLLIDFDGGQSILGDCAGGVCPAGVSDPDGDGVADPDPQCVGRPWKDRETKRWACGLGYGLPFLLIPLVWRRRRAPRDSP